MDYGSGYLTSDTPLIPLLAPDGGHYEFATDGDVIRGGDIVFEDPDLGLPVRAPGPASRVYDSLATDLRNPRERVEAGTVLGYLVERDADAALIVWGRTLGVRPPDIRVGQRLEVRVKRSRPVPSYAQCEPIDGAVDRLGPSHVTPALGRAQLFAVRLDTAQPICETFAEGDIPLPFATGGPTVAEMMRQQPFRPALWW